MTDAKNTASYQAVTFADLPDWASDNHLAALMTFVRSCDKLIAQARAKANRASKAVAATAMKDAAKPTPGTTKVSALLNACLTAKRLGQRLDPATRPVAMSERRAAARKFFELHFTPHRVIHNGPPSILTGYYEPELPGSRTPQGRFQTPIFRRPADLVNLVSETDRATVGSGLSHARKTQTGLEPYATRAQIEAGSLAGQDLELLYLADPVDAFFLQIQGSGRIKLSDGTAIRVTYDGKNGHPYSSIGRYLIDQGVIGAETMSLAALGNYLKADRQRGASIMQRNASFVFFRELQGAEAAGAHGVMNIQLTPGRSLAIDPSHHEMGLPIYVSAPDLRHVEKTKGFHRLMVGQDVGSAIKGPERGDIFFGSGDKAGQLAGVTKATGTFFVLLPSDQPGVNQPGTDWAPTITIIRTDDQTDTKARPKQAGGKAGRK